MSARVDRPELDRAPARATVLVRGAPPARPARGPRRPGRPADPRRRDRGDRRARARSRRPTGAEVVDAEGLHAFPAFVDPHVHLRTPGREDEEDIDTGTRSAAAGGYCAILAMPNTDPVVDSAPVLRLAARARPRRGADPHRLHRGDHRRPGGRAS